MATTWHAIFGELWFKIQKNLLMEIDLYDENICSKRERKFSVEKLFALSSMD